MLPRAGSRLPNLSRDVAGDAEGPLGSPQVCVKLFSCRRWLAAFWHASRMSADEAPKTATLWKFCRVSGRTSQGGRRRVRLLQDGEIRGALDAAQQTESPLLHRALRRRQSGTPQQAPAW